LWRIPDSAAVCAAGSRQAPDALLQHRAAIKNAGLLANTKPLQQQHLNDINYHSKFAFVPCFDQETQLIKTRLMPAPPALAGSGASLCD
jgi:hypothetical protein